MSSEAGQDESCPPLTGVYDDLRGLAAGFLSRQRPDHTLQPTALVHEAYLRLIQQRRPEQMDRQSFYLVAAKAMRNILVDHARRRRAQKRRGDRERVPLDETVAAYEDRAIDLVAINDTLEKLSEVDAELARIVDLRFFGGLTEEETAEVLGVSPRTVRRGWRVAKQWLYSALKPGDERGVSDHGE